MRCQTDKRQNRHNHDDQSDQIDNLIHFFVPFFENVQRSPTGLDNLSSTVISWASVFDSRFLLAYELWIANICKVRPWAF
jgi:hypothetical protein